MKLVSFFNQYNVKLKTAMLVACTIGVILIIYAFFYVFFKSNNNPIKQTSFLKLNSYIAEYNVVIKSNKSENSYNIKEWYEKNEENEKIRFEYNDFVNNKTTIIINGDKYKIENFGQIAKFVSIRNKQKGINIYSLSTYINIINSLAFDTEIAETEVTTKYSVNLKSINNQEESKKFKELLENEINITKVELLVIASKPSKISIFSGEEEKIIIEYNLFSQDDDIDENIFEV